MVEPVVDDELMQQRQGQCSGVGKHMPRIGKQSEAIGEQATDDFHHHKRGDNQQRYAQHFFIAAAAMVVVVCVVVRHSKLSRVRHMCHSLSEQANNMRIVFGIK